MPRACVLLRTSDHYRADAFRAGLARHGYRVEKEWHRQPRPDDLVLLWNRTRGWEAVADIYERAGARVVIAENGYIRKADGGKWYALALDRHNGAGRWYVGDQPRFPIEDKPWRQSGRHVLVLPQRGIGSRGVAMPHKWQKAVVDKLRRITDRRIVVRPHPGNSNPPLDPDLADAHCAVTWGSGAGIKALQAGIPVFHEMPNWIGESAAARLAGDIESCNTPSREQLWTRISWAQWGLSEIQSGEAFDRLLHEENSRLFCAGRTPIGAGR